MARPLKLSPADHALVSAATTEAELGTDGEIVTIVAGRSDAYHDVALHWAVLLMFLALAVIAAWPDRLVAILGVLQGGWVEETSTRALLTLLLFILVAKFLVARLILAWMPLRMALTPTATKGRRVRRRAVELFRAAAERRTRARTGVLIYLSLAERRAELIADETIHGKVAPERWGEAIAALIDAVRDGRPGEGMAAAVHQIGAILAEHFPRSEDDVNELPDRLIEL